MRSEERRVGKECRDRWRGEECKEKQRVRSGRRSLDDTQYVLIFFFQAEDGIRDRNVTGVQTCALPIFGAPMLAETQGAKDMYGLIVKLTAVGGKREELIKLLTGAAVDMPGCFSYEIGRASCRERV